MKSVSSRGFAKGRLLSLLDVVELSAISELEKVLTMLAEQADYVETYSFAK